MDSMEPPFIMSVTDVEDESRKGTLIDMGT